MSPIRRRFRLLLFLVIVFSFLIGFPIHMLDLEVTSVAKSFGPNGRVLEAVEVLLLITAHLALISLLFIKDTVTYKRYLMLFPVLFLAMQFLNGMGLYSAEPRLLLTALPFCVTYFICLYQYTKLHQTEKANASR